MWPIPTKQKSSEISACYSTFPPFVYRKSGWNSTDASEIGYHFLHFGWSFDPVVKFLYPVFTKQVSDGRRVTIWHSPFKIQSSMDREPGVFRQEWSSLSLYHCVTFIFRLVVVGNDGSSLAPLLCETCCLFLLKFSSPVYHSRWPMGKMATAESRWSRWPSSQSSCTRIFLYHLKKIFH